MSSYIQDLTVACQYLEPKEPKSSKSSIQRDKISTCDLEDNSVLDKSVDETSRNIRLLNTENDQLQNKNLSDDNEIDNETNEKPKKNQR